MGNTRISAEGVLHIGLGIMSLVGYGVPKSYSGGITSLVNGLELLFAEPHEVGSVTVTSATPAAPSAS
ncbi:MAG: hypothetical protein HQK99_08535 [Nitrospirae bacterium]|nr:hypothetical protein [Nitrospirota bacterium]